MAHSWRYLPAILIWFLCPAWLQAEPKISTAGTLVIVPAYSEVRQANDEAQVIWAVEAQDKDRVAAASRVNQKMKHGMEVIRRADPQATFQTRGYYTFPVYQDEPPRAGAKPRQPTAWRVGQHLEMTTANLDDLPKTAAAAQGVLSLHGLQFRLSEAAAKKLEERRIEGAYRNLTQRIAAIAQSMGRNLQDAALETIDFEGSGAYAQQAELAVKTDMRALPSQAESLIEEPKFEPGETTLQMRVVGKFRLK